MFKVLKLNKNLRCIDKEFSELLLKIGDGKIENFIIPESWKTDDVCSKINGNVNNNNIENSVILAPHNEQIDQLNSKILKLMNGKLHTYYSVDYATYKGVNKTDDNIYLKFPLETLNSIREGLPPYKLELKIHAQVILLRNSSGGLCNGTRLNIKNLYKYNIEAVILTEENIGSTVFIPRITSNTEKNSSFSFTLYRKQFPIRLAFAITINKSQGQDFENLGLYIHKPPFSH